MLDSAGEAALRASEATWIEGSQSLTEPARSPASIPAGDDGDTNWRRMKHAKTIIQ